MSVLYAIYVLYTLSTGFHYKWIKLTTLFDAVSHHMNFALCITPLGSAKEKPYWSLFTGKVVLLDLRFKRYIYTTGLRPELRAIQYKCRWIVIYNVNLAYGYHLTASVRRKSLLCHQNIPNGPDIFWLFLHKYFCVRICSLLLTLEQLVFNRINIFIIIKDAGHVTRVTHPI